MPIVRDPIDAFALAGFVVVFFGLPAFGYVLMVVDYRAYLRSLRRALVVVQRYTLATPLWALRERPECLRAFDLDPGCTRDEVMAAYREKVKHAHPDRGGDRRQFDRLQRLLGEALRLVDEAERIDRGG